MDLFNSSKLTSSPDTSQVKHVGSSPHAILDQNQEHAKTLLVTPTDEKNTSTTTTAKKITKTTSHNFLTQDLPVVFPLRFPPSITLRAPSVTLLAFRYPLAFQIETNGDETGTNDKLNAVADPGEGAGGPGPGLPHIFRPK